MEVELMYSAVLISAVHQCDSIIYIDILFICFSVMMYHRMVNRVPRANQEDLFIHPIYTSSFSFNE